MTDPSTDAALYTAQIGRLTDQIMTRINTLDATTKRMEATLADHETRLRANTDAATSYKVWTGLMTGGGLAGLIALIKSLFP